MFFYFVHVGEMINSLEINCSTESFWHQSWDELNLRLRLFTCVPVLYIYIPTYLPTYLPTCLPTYLPTYIHIYIYISYKGLSSQQRIFCPQEGSQMDSQSKPRQSVMNCREVICGAHVTPTERNATVEAETFALLTVRA